MNPLTLPSHMSDLQTILKGLDWHAVEHEVAQEAQTRLVIVGPVNSGKSTLFNRLHGQRVSAVSAVPGTTKGVVEHPLGPFHLVDTPGFGEVWGTDRAEIARAAAQEADLIVLLLDAAAGVRQSDHDLYVDLQRFGEPIVVALNKADLVAKDLPWVLENAEKVLGLRPIAVSARTGRGVADTLLPAILQAKPALAIAMARELPGVRSQIVTQVIQQTAWFNAAISIQPIPGLDIPILLASQTRMVLRIAAAYGESMRVSHARELLTAMAGSLLSRFLGMQLAKLVPVLGWAVSSAVSATSTYAIGQTARRYFEVGGNVGAPDLQVLYQRWRKLAPGSLLRRKRRHQASTPERTSAGAFEGGGHQDEPAP